MKSDTQKFGRERSIVSRATGPLASPISLNFQSFSLRKYSFEVDVFMIPRSSALSTPVNCSTLAET